jgi:RNA 2',3'-cyclic 3'-phosphodiesterase
MRCFLALWPDEPARDRLHALARDWHQRLPAARRMGRENLHLTLAFIGELDAAIARQIVALLSEQTWQAGTWHVDRLGVFDKARVLWAGSGDDVHLAAVASKARQILEALQVRFDRKPFVPHVTLLRNLPRAAFGTAQAIDPPIAWPMQSPALLYSTHAENGTRYVALDPSG